MIDLVMGLSALALGGLLGAFSAPLADHLVEGDERIRERFPWASAYEPTALATDAGRRVAFRAGLLLAAAAYVAVGTGLALGALVG